MKCTHHQQPGRFLCLPETRKFSHWLLQLLAIITTEHMIEVKSVPDGKVLQPWKPNLKPKSDASLKEAPSWGFTILGSILALGGLLAISETNSEDLSSNIRWEFHQSIAFVKIQTLFCWGVEVDFTKSEDVRWYVLFGKLSNLFHQGGSHYHSPRFLKLPRVQFTFKSLGSGWDASGYKYTSSLFVYVYKYTYTQCVFGPLYTWYWILMHMHVLSKSE